MEVPLKEETAMTEEKRSRKQKGGLITMPFILVANFFYYLWQAANESFEKVASFGLLPNMIIYLLSDYHTSVAHSTIVLLIGLLLQISCQLLVLSFLIRCRFLTIFLGSIFSVMGMILLWLKMMIPDTKPPLCDIQVSQSCESPTPIRYALLFSAFGLMSIGAGGVRMCSLAFGADQIDSKDNPKRERMLESFFGGIMQQLLCRSLLRLLVLFIFKITMDGESGLGSQLFF